MMFLKNLRLYFPQYVNSLNVLLGFIKANGFWQSFLLLYLMTNTWLLHNPMSRIFSSTNKRMIIFSILQEIKALYSRVMKVLKNLEYHHWHSLKSKLDYQWPTCPKRTGKEFEKQDLQSSKVFPSAQGKMGWNGQPFSGFHTSKNENAFKLSYVWEVPWESNLRG